MIQLSVDNGQDLGINVPAYAELGIVYNNSWLKELKGTLNKEKLQVDKICNGCLIVSY